MKGLTGIKKDKINRLRENELHTFELLTVDNVGIAEKMETRENIFITKESKKDVKTGTKGVIAEVKSHKTFYQKVDTLFDEENTLSARLQVEYIGEAEVTSVIFEDEGIEVEIEEDVWMG